MQNFGFVVVSTPASAAPASVATASTTAGSCPEISFSPEEQEIIMGKAFAKLMGV